MRIAARELLGAESISHLRSDISEWKECVPDYYAIADVIGRESARELLAPGHKFSDAPSKVAVERAASVIEGKWKWRQVRRLADRVAESALQDFKASLERAGFRVEEGKVKGCLLQAFGVLESGEIEQRLKESVQYLA